MQRPFALALAALLALTPAVGATLMVTDPVSAECSVGSQWPLFQYAAPRADRIVIGTVTRVVHHDDHGIDPSDFTIRVEDRFRGPSPATVLLHEPYSYGDDCLEDGLRARVGDRIAVAWGTQGDSGLGVSGPISAIAFVGGPEAGTAITRQGERSRMQQVTAAQVRQLARLPAADLAFFSADGGRHGRELWRTDGTRAGTRLVSDIAHGDASSDPQDLVSAVGLLFFTADDGVHGREPWVTDGTDAGTRMLRDVLPGPAGSAPTGMAAIGDQAWFAADDGVQGRELWAADGTRRGTTLVVDARPGPVGSDPTGMTLVNGAVIFSADDGLHGREPWTTRDDSTFEEKPGILADIQPGPLGSDPMDFVPFGSSGLFSADDGVHGRQLWLDGRMMPPTRPTGSDPDDLLVLRSPDSNAVRIFYTALDRDGGRRLYATAATWSEDAPTPRGPVALTDARPAADTAPWFVTPVGGRVYFSVPVTGGGPHLWVTESIPESTYPVTDTDGLAIGSLIASPDRLAFTTTGVGSQGAVWAGAGTIGTVRPSETDLTPTAPDAISRFRDQFLFGAVLPQGGREPWVLSGPGRGFSEPLRDIRPGPVGSDPSGFVWLRITSSDP